METTPHIVALEAADLLSGDLLHDGVIFLLININLLLALGLILIS